MENAPIITAQNLNLWYGDFKALKNISLDVGERAEIAAAFDRYDRVMRPYVDRCQTLANTLDRYAPMTEKEISDTATAMAWMQRWPLRPIASRLWFKTAESIALPHYSACTR